MIRRSSILSPSLAYTTRHSTSISCLTRVLTSPSVLTASLIGSWPLARTLQLVQAVFSWSLRSRWNMQPMYWRRCRRRNGYGGRDAIKELCNSFYAFPLLLMKRSVASCWSLSRTCSWTCLVDLCRTGSRTDPKASHLATYIRSLELASYPPKAANGLPQVGKTLTCSFASMQHGDKDTSGKLLRISLLPGQTVEARKYVRRTKNIIK